MRRGPFTFLSFEGQRREARSRRGVERFSGRDQGCGVVRGKIRKGALAQEVLYIWRTGNVQVAIGIKYEYWSRASSLKERDVDARV